jgi:adenylyl- and sulfurtransferase ThiI
LLTAMQRSGLLILRPLVGWEKAKIAELAEKVY